MLISSPTSLRKQASKPFRTTAWDLPYFGHCWSLDITVWLAVSWNCSHQKTKFLKLPSSQSYPMLPYSDFCLYIKALKEKVKVPRHSKKQQTNKSWDWVWDWNYLARCCILQGFTAVVGWWFFTYPSSLHKGNCVSRFIKTKMHYS